MARWAKLTLLSLAVLVAFLGAGVAGLVGFAGHLEDEVGREDVLSRTAALPKITQKSEYVVVTKGGEVTGQNYLVLGVDTRAGWSQSRSRSDTIMLVHLNKARTHATVVSFPRDSYVYIPPVPGKWAGGKTKINAAYAWGGAPLVVQVVGHLTGLTIDHVVRVDFAAIRKITDIVGGVDVTVRKTVRDGRTGFVFPAGVNHLDGKKAEIYVRQRYGLPQGDFDRVKRQQQYLRALADKVVSLGVLTNPRKLNNLLGTAAKALVVDQGLNIAGTVRALAGLRPADLSFTTIPSKGFVRSSSGTANRLDTAACRELFAALTTDTMTDYFRRNPGYRAVTGA